MGLGRDIKIHDNMFWRTEYEHTRLTNSDYEFCGGGCPATIGYSRNTLRFGLGWIF